MWQSIFNPIGLPYRAKGYAVGDYSFLQEINFIDEFAKVVNVAQKCDTTEECFGSPFLGEGRTYKCLNNNLAISLYADKALLPTV